MIKNYIFAFVNLAICLYSVKEMRCMVMQANEERQLQELSNNLNDLHDRFTRILTNQPENNLVDFRRLISEVMLMCERYIQPYLSRAIDPSSQAIILYKGSEELKNARKLRKFLHPALSLLKDIRYCAQQQKKANLPGVNFNSFQLSRKINYIYFTTILTLAFLLYEYKSHDKPDLLIRLIIWSLIIHVAASCVKGVKAELNRLACLNNPNTYDTMIDFLPIRAIDYMIRIINEALSILEDFDHKLDSAIARPINR